MCPRSGGAINIYFMKTRAAAHPKWVCTNIPHLQILQLERDPNNWQISR